MRISGLPFALLVTAISTCLSAHAQDFSNRGKEFWLAYCYHVGMVNPGGAPTMTLYITGDSPTTFTVEIFGGPVIQTGTISPGQVVTSEIPSAYFINDEGVFNNKAIHITSAQPVVVYSYITRSQASGATLCLPASVLGKEYYSMNFTQVSNEPNSNSYLTIVAVENNTTVEITPSGDTKNGWRANRVYTISLNKGDIYQVLGALDPANTDAGADLTGTHIKSISSGPEACKRIAVFSGSGKVRIPQNCNSTSSDNLYQQLYPTVSWGLKYLTVPSYNNPYNYYRVVRSNSAAKVYVNGVLVPSSFFTSGNWFQFFNSIPNLIESDSPVSVAQYFTTQDCDGNGSPYDPDMIVLNPVEQNINKVTLVSSNLFAPGVQQHNLQVIIPRAGTALASFRLDGAAVNGWKIHPGDSKYAYLYLANVAQGNHTLSSDSGFNALAYGYATAESYGYSAGANVKDLYQFISIHGEHATVNFPSTCRNSPFYFSITFPYQPAKIEWHFFGLLKDTALNAPRYDSTWFLNGRQLFRYKLPSSYSISSTGTHPVQVVAQNPTSDGCSGVQQIDYSLEVYDPPTVNFSFASNGCSSDSVHFLGTANTAGRSITGATWMFGDGSSASGIGPVHLYRSGGDYVVKYAVMTDVGCLSDTAKQTISLSEPAAVKFNLSSPACINQNIGFSSAAIPIGEVIVKWKWNFGDGDSLVQYSSAPVTHSYHDTGKYMSTLEVQTDKGCVSSLASKDVVVNAVPVVNFILPQSCVNDPYSLFIDSSSIQDGSQNQFAYSWDFGDASTSAQKNPRHKFTAAGPYNITETVTSNSGCVASTTKTFFVNGVAPVPAFELQEGSNVCSGDSIHLVDHSFVSPGNIMKLRIYWNYAGDSADQTTDYSPVSGKIYAHVYPQLDSNALRSVVIRYVAYSGGSCAQYIEQPVTLKPKPELQFNPLQGMCSDAPAFQITAARILNGLPGIGTFHGSGISQTGMFTAASAKIGIDTIRFSYTADNGCRNQIDQTIAVYPVPLVDAGPDKLVLEGEGVSLTPAVRSLSPVSFAWTPSIWLSNALIEAPKSAPQTDIIYTLTVVTANGCASSDHVMVKVLKTPRIPNVFSPNHDGIHDKWEIPYLSGYAGCTVDIYNRYGQLVFHSVGYATPWDGTVSGNDAPVGTYYYIIDPKNGRSKMSGYVDIIR